MIKVSRILVKKTILTGNYDHQTEKKSDKKSGLNINKCLFVLFKVLANILKYNLSNQEY